MAFFKKRNGHEPAIGSQVEQQEPRLGGSRAAERYAKALENKDERLKAIQSLEQLGTTAVEAVSKRLTHSDRHVRDAAAYILGRIGSPECIPKLKQCLQDKDPSVREVTAYALGQIESVQAIPSLLVALNDRSDKVVAAATYALCRIELPMQLVETIERWPEPSANT